MEPTYVIINTSDYCLIAAHDPDGSTVGHLTIRPRVGTYGTRRYAEITELKVREADRRHGIGTELIQRARKWASERKYTHVAVEAGATSNSAIQFYGTCGFSPRSVIMDLEL
jgi:GNAT superfamily N-acetyltransferase